MITLSVGVVTLWLVRSFRDRAVRVPALALNSVLCSWARLLSFRMPLFPPRSINGYRGIVGEISQFARE